ncbi:T9SS type A sorting domain-containing protein [Flavobacterium sp.]|uniref:T9SS type A sorting domain-containing protein n=1 Tax=Flavobacterium sp. TaxID=239 RepID=UPI0025FEF2FA|nr:T9SS type A sorting domain-containing protein [Flavobacterium sp.]
MKKIITLIISLAFLISNGQCPAPSNIALLDNVELSWTENGTATAWEVAVIPNFSVGDALPTFGIITSTTTFYITDLPQSTDCYAYFVRSICSPTNVSPWAATGSSVCSVVAYNYLITLSNDNFISNSNNNRLQIVPNPTKNVIQIKNNAEIEKITIFDSFGKEVLTQIQNINEIDVENLSEGIYLMEIQIENEKVYKKFIKE